jgi:tRNA modification GTPase
MDSAGIQDTRDPVERIGIERTRGRFDSCDLILMVTDASQGVTAADRDLYRCLRHKDPLIVVNKMDLVPDTRENATTRPWPAGSEVHISAKFDQGIPRLHQAIAERIFDDAEGLDGERVLPNLRQTEGIKRAATGVRRALACIGDSANAFELAAIDLAEARKAVDEVLGLRAGDDVLDRIFSQFCIGK